MKHSITRWLWAAALLPLASLACSEGGLDVVDPDPDLGTPSSDARISVFITDAPGDVDEVWLQFDQIYLQGDGVKEELLTEPTELIEVSSLVGEFQEIVDGLEIPEGTYKRLLLVVGDGYLVDDEGNVYVKGDPTLPEGVEATGQLHCPSCSNNGIKVIFPKTEMGVEGEVGLVLDFDIAQSFGHPAGNSGKWIMKPVIHASMVEDEDQDGDVEDDVQEDSEIKGIVALAEGVTIPMCGGAERSLEDFVPTATAQNLEDEDNNPIVRTGSTDGEGEFEIGNLENDTYDLGYIAEVPFGTDVLTWTASAAPATATIDGGDVEGVEYTVTEVTCEIPMP